MSGNASDKNTRIKFIIALVACLFIGITFLVAGTGKLGPAEGGWAMPGQTIDFISRILPNEWIMSDAFAITYNYIFPIAVPTIELIIAVFLIIGFMPRFWAVITIPLTLIFIADNSYAMYIGTEKFASCSCFGFWENIFGSLTPMQSFAYDIVLLAAAIVIIVLHPGGFFQSREWLRNLGKKKETKKTAESK